MSDQKFQNTLSFWRAVEALSPQEVPKVKKNDTTKPGRDLGEMGVPPWFDEDFARLPLASGKEWSFTVFAGLIEREDLVHALGKVIGRVEDVFDERLNGVSCLFSLRCNALGRPIAESFVLCMSTWAAGVAMRSGLAYLSAADSFDNAGLHQPQTPIKHSSSRSGFAGFDSQAKALRDELAWRISMLPVETGVTMEWLHDFAGLVAKKCGVLPLFGSSPVNRIMAWQSPIKRQDEQPKPDDELINSFFIRDINRVLQGGLKGASVPLRSFVKGLPEDVTARIDVRSHRAKLLEHLEPDRFPAGCWPSEHPLVWSQQLAINAAWCNLREADGVFSVNGPPGTGKTTLLRDFVAAIVVERARELCKLGGRAFQGEQQFSVGAKTLSYFPLAPSLAGFSIVVASSNNGAVENLSLELPLQKAIDPKWLGETDFFKELAGLMLGEPAWGLLAGKLGNGTNRQQFQSKLYWSKEDANGVSGMREFLEKAAKPSFQGRWSFAQAKHNFDLALATEQRLREELQNFQDLPKGREKLEADLATQTQTAGDASAAIVPIRDQHRRFLRESERTEEEARDALRALEAYTTLKPGFWESLFSFGSATRTWRVNADEIAARYEECRLEKSSAAADFQRATALLEEGEKVIADATDARDRTREALGEAEKSFAALSPQYLAYVLNIDLSEDALERSSPWSVPKWREARIKVFLAALDLHRAFIEENAAKMQSNLGLAAEMLSKGLPDTQARIAAFDSLALVCPVVSTAFASVQAMFGDVEQPAIGWLLIDEAGQAPPQACVGALWRSKRAIVVGDPLQIEPVVTIPHSVEAALAEHYGGVDSTLFPTGTSAQRLADSQMVLGTTIGRDPRTAVWVGAPLRVHRRCDDPMFTISNAIAYNGLMVHQKKPSALPLPASHWLDVPTQGPTEGNWIPAEGVALEQLLLRLREHNQTADAGIFLVSPFKDVASSLVKYGRLHRIDARMVGTVHTTQGKEAEVVILVLGGGSAGARDWAAEKSNLLNVAVSRAKSRLYVIGDKADWGARPFFDEMARRL